MKLVAHSPNRRLPSVNENALVGLMVLVATLPLYWDVKHSELPLARLATGFESSDVEPSTRVHLVVPLVAILAVLAIWRRRHSLRHPVPLLVAGIVASFTVSIIWGYANGAGLYGLLFYAQTLVPIAAWFVGYRLGAEHRTIARAVMAGVLFTGVLALVFTLFSGGIDQAFESSRAFEAAVPQYRAYFPVLVALACAVAVTQWATDRWLSLSTLVVAAALLPIMWSRAGILMVLVATYGAIYLLVLRRPSWRRLVATTVAAVSTAAVLAVVLLTVGLWRQRRELSDLGASDQNRVDLARDAGGRLGSSPWVGDAFRPSGDSLAGGATASFDRLFPTHNQYLDYALRGGFPAAVLLVAVLAATAWLALRRWRGRGADRAPANAVVCLAFLAALVPGALTELYISQTWTGVVVMAFLGHCTRTFLGEPNAVPEEAVAASAESEGRGTDSPG